jgi:hypothetical protein
MVASTCSVLFLCLNHKGIGCKGFIWALSCNLSHASCRNRFVHLALLLTLSFWRDSPSHFLREQPYADELCLALADGLSSGVQIHTSSSWKISMPHSRAHCLMFLHSFMIVSSLKLLVQCKRNLHVRYLHTVYC